MMRQGLAKYIIQNRDYCEVNVIVINYLFEHKNQIKDIINFLENQCLICNSDFKVYINEN